LPQPALRLHHSLLGLPLCRIELGADQFNQHITRLDALPFGHRHTRHRPSDLRADVHPVRRLHPATGHHGLQHITALHRLGLHLRP
jgi:hypothetical protein